MKITVVEHLYAMDTEREVGRLARSTKKNALRHKMQQDINDLAQDLIDDQEAVIAAREAAEEEVGFNYNAPFAYRLKISSKGGEMV